MAKRIRNLHLIFSFDTEQGGGGITRVATTLAKNLDKEKFEVSICALAGYGTKNEKLRIADLKNQGIEAITASQWIEERPYHCFIKSTRFLYSYLKTNPVDILHSHSEFSDITSILLKLSANSSAIVRTVHYGYYQEWRKKTWRRLFLTNILYPFLFNAETGVNQTIVNRLNHRLAARILGKKARLIYNAVDLNRFSHKVPDKDSLKKELGLPPTSIVVSSIGRLAEQKGFHYLIAAIPLILKFSPHIYFLIIGDGDLAETLRQQANELNINKNLIFTGPRSDIVHLLQISDIYVSSSLWEGLPVTLLEAMASQLPIVATNIPGTNELLQNHLSGLLVPPADPQKLAEAICQLVQDLPLRNKLVQYASERISQFSLDQIVHEYEHLYQEII